MAADDELEGRRPAGSSAGGHGQLRELDKDEDVGDDGGGGIGLLGWDPDRRHGARAVSLVEDGDEEDKAQPATFGGGAMTDAALAAMEVVDLDDPAAKPFQYRPERLFFPGQSYDLEDLDLTKPPAAKPMVVKKQRAVHTTRTVLDQADFRNVRFLANYLTDTGNLVPRRQTRVSAKAQRKMVREVKTARALGLLPFTSIGRPPFRAHRFRQGRPSDLDGS
eukprot:SM000004S15002  [mRNA]  locus=s4:721695:722930:+ [translate_table: standard]